MRKFVYIFCTDENSAGSCQPFSIIIRIKKVIALRCPTIKLKGKIKPSSKRIIGDITETAFKKPQYFTEMTKQTNIFSS